MILRALEGRVPKRPSPTDKHVGGRIRMARRARDISQSALADALGISFQQIQKYEYGKSRVSAGRLQHIARILEMPVTLFFDRDASPRPETQQAPDRPSAYVSEFLATPEGMSFAKSFVRIKSHKFRSCIVHLVADFAAWDTR